MLITPYKSRTIDTTKPVKVYKNLTNGKWSIKQGRKVVAHADEIFLRDPYFEVNEAGRQRVLRERKKYVHAYVCGHLSLDTVAIVGGRQVTYNPYKGEHFKFFQDGSPVFELPGYIARIDATGVHVVRNHF